MAATLRLTRSPTAALFFTPVTLTRLAIIVTILAIWEVTAASGLLYRDVVPSIVNIVRALIELVGSAELYRNLGTTGYEVASAVAIGGLAGVAVGIVLGGSAFFARAYEPFLYYLGPTPKIIFFPIMIMWFGVGPGSKVAMGAISCFFPVALSTAVGMRQIDKVLIRVGRSFRCSTAQMVRKIYLPAMRLPVINGLRLGFGVAVIGVLLAETKLSNRGLGFMIIQSYTSFNMPRMYAMLIIVFVLAAILNALVSMAAQTGASRRFS
jgi:ABC-type nitrate/sulfonate/bicarbonate transport system permease component